MVPELAFDHALLAANEDEPRDLLAFDKLSLRKFDVDGRMHVAACNISKSNVCPYYGREIPNYQALGLDPNRVYKLYRDPEELAKAAPTFRNLQLLLLHSKKPVTAENPARPQIVGCVGTDTEFVYPYLKASIAVWIAEAIKLIERNEVAELSASYRYRAEMTAGTTPEGVAYDGVMRDITANHVALVEDGRAGPDVCVSDSQPAELPKMFKRPRLLGLAIAAAFPGITVSDEVKVAMDNAMCGAYDKDIDEEEETKRKKKLAADAVTPGPTEGHRGAALVVDSAAMDAAIATKIAEGGFISKADADKLANDAADKATKNAIASVNALHKARRDVEPLVGVVAMDSADEVYAFALKKSDVAIDGVSPTAFPALIEQVKARKVAAGAAKPTVANDAAIGSAVATALPGLGRFAKG